MIRPSRLFCAVVVLAMLGSLTAPDLLAGRVRNRTLVGDIEALDSQSKVIKIDLGLDRSELVFYDDDTKIKGGDLEVGRSIRVRFTIKSRYQKVATSIKLKD